jgi:hypothetical protein
MAGNVKTLDTLANTAVAYKSSCDFACEAALSLREEWDTTYDPTGREIH